MFITITRSGQIELQDAANFRAFKILDRSGKSPVELAAVLDGFATLTPDGTAAWVDASAVPKLLPVAPTAEWQTSFNAMLAAASKFGWVNEATGAVRAHIERAEVM
jgi:hypothetical protein